MGIFVEHDKNRTFFTVSKRLPDGSRIRRRFTNRKAAQAMQARVELAIATGEWRDLQRQLARGPGKSPTVIEYAREWLDGYCRPRLTEATMRRYELSVRTIAAHRLGGTRISALTRERIDEFVRWRRERVSPSSVNKDLIVLKSLLSYAYRTGVSKTNLGGGYRLLSVQEVPRRIPTSDEVERVIGKIGSLTVKEMAILAAETGLRLGELLGLTWDAVDLPNRTLTVSQTKGKRVRVIPLTSRAVEALRGLVRHIDTNRVFIHDSGKPWSNPHKAFKVAAAAAGVPWLGWHSLRHYRATMWLRHGVNVRLVQQLLGHRDLTTTSRYLHALEGDAADAVRRAEMLESQERSGRQAGDGPELRVAMAEGRGNKSNKSNWL
jgi:integrase